MSSKKVDRPHPGASRTPLGGWSESSKVFYFVPLNLGGVYFKGFLLSKFNSEWRGARHFLVTFALQSDKHDRSFTYDRRLLVDDTRMLSFSITTDARTSPASFISTTCSYIGCDLVGQQIKDRFFIWWLLVLSRRRTTKTNEGEVVKRLHGGFLSEKSDHHSLSLPV